MQNKGFQLRFFSAASFLTILTVIVSFTVAFLHNGTLFAPIRIVDLRSYGGTTFEDLCELQLWRIPVAQTLHVKPLHMLLNALGLLLMGSLLERAIGPVKLFIVWLVAGGIATAFSPILVEAPWNVGTGASQATFAFAGCASMLAVTRDINRKWAIGLIALIVVPGLLLDFIFAGYPKPGHVSAYLLGAAFGMAFAVHGHRAPRPRPGKNRREPPPHSA